MGAALALGAALWLCGGGVARGQSVDTLLATNLFEPYGVSVGPGNEYYITDSARNRVVRHISETGAFNLLAGGVGLDSAGAADASNGQLARFYNPQGVVSVPGGLVVADTGNHLIRRVAFANGAVTTLSGDLNGAALSHEAGIPPDNYGFRDGAGAGAQFNAPSGLAFDGVSHVYVADTLNNAIRKVNIASGVTTTVATGLNRPSGVAVGPDGRVYVADTGSHSVKAFFEGQAPRLVAGSGSTFASGLKDGVNATNGLLRLPRNVFWAGAKTELLVADSGNGALRRVSNLSGTPALEVYLNTTSAGLGAPVGLAQDLNNVLLITDISRNELRGIRLSQTTQPQVATPLIGTVTLTNAVCGTILQVITNGTFNNEVTLAILAESATQTFYTFGSTLDFDEIADPRPSDNTPPLYSNCQDALPENLLSRINPRPPRLTIKAYSTQADRKPSLISVANFIFQAGNPVYLGSNPASFQIDSITSDAAIYYTVGETVEGTSDPSPENPLAIRHTRGRQLNVFNGTKNVVVKARAYRDSYLPSAVVTKTFLAGDAQFNTIEIPKDYIAGIGSTLVVPVEVGVAAGNVVQSLQFRVEAELVRGTRPPTLGVLRVGPDPFLPAPFAGINNSVALSFTNAFPNDAVAVGFFGPNPANRITNLTAVALLRVAVPASAADGDQYRLVIREPSATSDGGQSGTQIITTSPRLVTVSGKAGFLVGDVASSRGYNRGEFGNGILDNSDVNPVLAAALGFQVPFDFTAVFSAMDAHPPAGDGQIRYLDWQTIYFRSLRLDPDNYHRFWTPGGGLVSVSTNLAQPNLAAEPLAAEGASAQVVWRRGAGLRAGVAESVIQSRLAKVPVYLTRRGAARVSGFQFAASVVPAGVAPTLGVAARYVAEAGQPAPAQTGNPVVGGVAAPNRVYAAWNLGDFAGHPEGETLIGHLEFNMPAQAVTGQRYEVVLERADGASDYQQPLDFETVRGQAWVNVPAPAPQDLFPDEWKLQFFGSASAAVDPRADPDGDGYSHWTEYLNGTDPRQNDLRIHRIFRQSTNIVLEWFAPRGVAFRIESRAALGEPWARLGEVAGGGGPAQFATSDQPTQTRFYRIRVEPNQNP